MFDGYGYPHQSGAFEATQRDDGNYKCHGGTFNWGTTVDFNASWISNIYGNSETVQPLSLSAKLILKY